MKLNYLLYPLCVPHWIYYCKSSADTKSLIRSDIDEMNRRRKITKKRGLFYWIAFHKPYRNLFYYRIPKSMWLRHFVPSYPMFFIDCIEGIGGGCFCLNHPYATVLSARKIGCNFTFSQLTTLGNKRNGRNDLVPTIGDNVTLCANVTIVGDVRIGNNVVVGAGSVVVKDIPDNCIVVGNPARIIEKK